MASDEDVIYVDVVPKLDERETEKATSKLRDKLKSGMQGTGKAIGDTLHSELSHSLDSAHGYADKLLKEFSGGDAIKGIQEKFGAVEDLAKTIGVDMSGWLPSAEKAKEPLDDLGTKTKDVLSSVKDVASQFEGMPGKIGAAASKVTGMATEIGAVVGAAHELYEQFSQPLDIKINASGDFGEWLEHHTPGNLGKDLADSLGADSVRKWMGKTFGYDPEHFHFPGDPTAPYPALPPPGPGGPSGIHEPIPYPKDFIGPIAPGATRAPGGQWGPGPAPSAPKNPYKDWYPQAHTSAAITGPGTHVTLADFTTPSDPAGVVTAGRNVSTLLAFASSLEGTPYSTQLRNDCSGIVSELASVAAGLPPPTSGQRFSTANEGSALAALGFQSGMGGPNDFNVGWYNGGPGGGHTSATLPGGISAEQGGAHGSFTLGAGAAGAGSPEYTNHAYLPMGMGSPGARGAGYGLPRGFPYGGMPGVPSGANPASPTQQRQTGYGQGFGISGGLLGAAEQAGAMAAGIGGFGGGSVAAEIGIQEANLAIQEGGKAAAIASTIPAETFKLGGGQMGAPSVGQGWFGKIAGGLIGQGFSALNISGSTQQPAQPGDQTNQSGQGAGGQGGQGAPQNGGKAPPSGHADDPIHVQSVNPGGQGGATSAMNATGVQSAIPV